MATHPDYPIDFKPAIASVDYDQTYDRLQFCQLLPQGQSIWFRIHIPYFDNIVIERFTPYNYVWAEQYSDYVYNFLKTFNFCPYNSLSDGSVIDIFGNTLRNPDNSIMQYVGYVPSNGFWWDVVKPVVFPEGKYRLSWITADNANSTFIEEGVRVFNQRFIEWDYKEDTEVNLNAVLNNTHLLLDVDDANFYGFCANSLIMQQYNGSAWVDYYHTDITENYYFYRDIADYFEGVKQEIIDYLEQRYSTYGIITVGSRTAQNTPLSTIIYGYDRLCRTALPLGYYPQRIELPIELPIVDGNITYTLEDNYSYDLQPIPQHFRDYCYLQRANNNYWGTGNLYPDLGIVPIANNISPDFLRLPNVSGVVGGVSHYLPDYDEVWTALYNTLVADLDSTVANWITSLLPIDPFSGAYDTPTEVVMDTISVLNVYGGHTEFDSTVALPEINYRGISIISFLRHLYTTELKNSVVENTGNGRWNLVFTPITLPSFCINSSYNHFSIQRLQGTLAESEADYQATLTSSSVSKLLQGNFTYSRNGITYNLLLDLINKSSSVTDYDLSQTWTSFSDTATVISSSQTLGNTFIDSALYQEFLPYSLVEFEEYYQDNLITETDYLNYLLFTKAQQEVNMVDSVRIKEIHACLGAGEFAFYDNNGTPTPYQMHIARNIDFLMKSFGIYYNPDGSIQSVVLNPAPPESEP